MPPSCTPGRFLAGRARQSAALGGLLLLAVGVSPAARATCTLSRLAEAPVVMVNMRPTVSARINGADASFLIDSGAFFSTLSRATVAQFNLRRSPAPPQLRVRGVGGETTDLALTTVKDFMPFGVQVPNVEFLVGGSEVGADVAGILGQNILRIADVEYDLANGVIRLMRVKGCEKSALAYWAGNQPFSEMDIDWATALHPHTTGVAYLNGVKIHVMFDSGAANSVVTLRGARRAGVKTDGADVVSAGYGYGIGRQAVRNWLAPVESFKIGAEEIKHTHLRLADFELGTADMLIGADFFLSHRIYVASSQRKLYFTYNGGPVFDLRRLADPALISSTAAAESKPAEPRQPEDNEALRTTAPGTERSSAADAAHSAVAAQPLPRGATTGARSRISRRPASWIRMSPATSSSAGRCIVRTANRLWRWRTTTGLEAGWRLSAGSGGASGASPRGACSAEGAQRSGGCRAGRAPAGQHAAAPGRPVCGSRAVRLCHPTIRSVARVPSGGCQGGRRARRALQRAGLPQHRVGQGAGGLRGGPAAPAGQNGFPERACARRAAVAPPGSRHHRPGPCSAFGTPESLGAVLPGRRAGREGRQHRCSGGYRCRTRAAAGYSRGRRAAPLAGTSLKKPAAVANFRRR